ncbi:hypothetical protein ACWEO4_14100 [Streptomyces sp. NPDC004393]|uniref:hypothetical protein n=1 Tax=Streptomyces sp. NPDC004533 TaxID=3154278 RepID=UPI0033BBD6C5
MSANLIRNAYEPGLTMTAVLLCWAAAPAGMTTTLSLLLGYFGENAQDLLPTRLAAIAGGAVLSVAAAWWLLPVRGRPTARSGGPWRRSEGLPAAVTGDTGR